MTRPSAQVRWPCCDCCGDAPECNFMDDGDRDRHIGPCPVCEVLCDCCGERHQATTAFAVPMHHHDAASAGSAQSVCIRCGLVLTDGLHRTGHRECTR